MTNQRLIDANATVCKTILNFARTLDSEYQRGYWDGVDMVLALVQAAPTVPAVVLPCKVGDVVWYLAGECAFRVRRIEIFSDDRILFLCGNDGTEDYMCFFSYEIGETVLIGEEAEAALRRAEG